MNPDKQQIAIAECCGWKRHEEYDYCLYGMVRRGEHLSFPDRVPAFEKDGAFSRPQYLPDYVNSLDRMHEAEKSLTWGQIQEYWTHLLQVVSQGMKRPATEHSIDGFAFMATARQRAEAFLRTVGKWEDEPERMNDQPEPTPATTSTSH